LEVDKTYGLGYGLHAGLCYTSYEQGWSFSLTLNDLLARTHWQNLPYSLVHLNTENEAIDQNGHTQYDPTISGYELTKNFTYTKEPKYHLAFHKTLSDQFGLRLELEGIERVTIPSLWLDVKHSEKEQFSFFYETRFESFGMTYQNESFIVTIASDDLHGSSSLGLVLGYHYTF